MEEIKNLSDLQKKQALVIVVLMVLASVCCGLACGIVFAFQINNLFAGLTIGLYLLTMDVLRSFWLKNIGI